MSPETAVGVAALAGGSAVALVVAYLLARLVVEPWRLLAGERERRARAEAERDVARADVERLASALAAQKKVTAALDEVVADDAFRPVAPGTGTDELRRQVEAEDRAAGDVDRDDVPRAVSHGTAPGGPGGSPRIPL